MSRNAIAGLFGIVVVVAIAFAIRSDAERRKPAGYDPEMIAAFQRHVDDCAQGKVKDAGFCDAMRRDLDSLQGQAPSH